MLGQGMWVGTLLVAGLLCLLAFYTQGGLNLETMTNTELGLTLGRGRRGGRRGARRAHGRRPPTALWPALLLLAFALLSAISIVWSVQPDASWRDAGAAALPTRPCSPPRSLLARVMPRRWPALLGGHHAGGRRDLRLGAVTKSFPNHFAEANRFARLYEPYGYWNALGLTAAIGAIGCMWLGARRAGHALLSALAYPAMGVLLLTLLLAYSRGALVALALGARAVVLPGAAAPARRGGAALGRARGGGDRRLGLLERTRSAPKSVPVAEAASAGHELGALVIAMVLLLSAVGVGVTFATGRRAPSALARRRAGIALALASLALSCWPSWARSRPATAASPARSPTPTTRSPTRTRKCRNTPGRLTAIASVRAQYWDEALKVFSAHPAAGRRRAGLRSRAPALPHRAAAGQTRARLRRADARRPRDRRPAAGARAARHLDGRRRAADASVQPPLAQLVGGAAGARPAWVSARARQAAPLRARAAGPADACSASSCCSGSTRSIDWTWYVPGLRDRRAGCARAGSRAADR